MAYKINDDCLACGACKENCPVDCISDAGAKYEIEGFGNGFGAPLVYFFFSLFVATDSTASSVTLMPLYSVGYRKALPHKCRRASCRYFV